MLYAISDLHLSLGSSKSMDVFPGWENYVELLDENWRKTVKENDTVVICGDISWALTLDESMNDFKFLDSLPGKKILLKGNHDYWWTSSKKILDFFRKNEFNSFKLLKNNCIEIENYCICGSRGWTTRIGDDHDIKMIDREIERLKFSINSAKDSKLEKIVFLHYPPVYPNEKSKILDFLLESNIKKCYYGHIHSQSFYGNIYNRNINGLKCELVSCDYIGFKPRLISSI